MHTLTNKANHSKEPWQQALIGAVTDRDELLRCLDLSEQMTPAMQDAMANFPLKVPRSYLARIKPGDWHDPLLQQILPLGIETVSAPGYQKEPLAESEFNPVPGLLHKYRSRVLLTVSGNCAINCRYCFRRNFDYAGNNPGQLGWQQAINYIAKNPEINEVILSGGDPLAVSDKMLTNLIEQIASVSHVRYLRVHTRLPIVIPARVTDGLLQALCGTRLKPIMVLHCNHAQEVDADIAAACQKMLAGGIELFNQTVILKGINDDAAVLAELSHTVFAAGVKPYYLHLLDKVQGAAHFDVELAEAKQLYKQLLEALPGYLVPKLVREVPGLKYKLPVL